jgi:hypothetical protein
MTPTPTLPDIQLHADGSISGINGLLDQISASLGRQIVPMLRHEILPIIQNDRDMQAQLGRAIGRQLALPLWLLLGSGAVYVAYRMQQGRTVNEKLDTLVDRVLSTSR